MLQPPKAIALTLILASCAATGSRARHADAFPVRAESCFDFAPWVDLESRERSQPSIVLERVTTAVPWPRGLALHPSEDRIVVLARGRHRRSGGVAPDIVDQAGSLFLVDTSIVESVIPGEEAGERVAGNAERLTGPSSDPFFLYDPGAGEPIQDTLMDRPYCTLRYDEVSSNYFICGYSGVDLPGGKFRKNATDSIHRYDLRTERWYPVEIHDASVVPEGGLSYTVSNAYYPHHDPETNAAPHGWLNGGDNAAVAGEFLYVVAKDNHLLVQYDLSSIRADAEAGPPESRPVLGSAAALEMGGEVREVPLYGHSALAVQDGYLYVGFRTSSVVVRFELDERGDFSGAPGELIAAFEPWDPETRKSANLMDIAFNDAGELFVACATRGRIWNVGVPDPDHVFSGLWDGASAEPYVDLPRASGKERARVGNILFDADGGLYICSGNYDGDNGLAGVIYRAQ